MAPDAFRSAKHFARHMLANGRLTLAPLREAIWTSPGHRESAHGVAMTCILFRAGCWQVEMLMIQPGSTAPMHRHNHCESADVILCGDLEGCIDGRSIRQPRGDNLLLNIENLPRSAWHAGSVASGLVALSFQRWIGMEPTFIAHDWESFDGHPG